MSLPLFGVFCCLVLASSVYSSGCDPSDVFSDGQCIKVISQEVNFTTARDYCHSRFDNLAVIKNGLDANYLSFWVPIVVNKPVVTFWIGLSRVSSNSRFTWDDGTLMYWNNLGNDRTHNYVAQSTDTSNWKTYDASENFPFVCTYLPKTPTTSGYGTTGDWHTTSSGRDTTTSFGTPGYTTTRGYGTTGYPETTRYPFTGQYPTTTGFGPETTANPFTNQYQSTTGFGTTGFGSTERPKTTNYRSTRYYTVPK